MGKKKEHKKNWVTLYTDASRHEDGFMAWSFWARHDNGRIKMAGMCPAELTNICHGEMYAICQGMHKVLNTLDDVEGFYITSDSMGAIRILGGKCVEATKKGKLRNPETVRLKIAFDKMVNERKLSTDLRHIKGHTGRKDARHWLNAWCDSVLKQVIADHRIKMEKLKTEI